MFCLKLMKTSWSWKYHTCHVVRFWSYGGLLFPTMGDLEILAVRNGLSVAHFVPIVSKFIANRIDVALIVSCLDGSLAAEPIERKPIIAATHGLLCGLHAIC